MFEDWKEDAIDAMLGAAEQLSPNNPIELTYEILKVDYRLGITARATHDKHRKEEEIRGKGLDGKFALRGGGWHPLSAPT